MLRSTLTIISLTLFAKFALAQDGLLPCTGLDCTICDLGVVFNTLVTYAVQFSFVAATVVAFWGGWKIMASRASEEAVKSGRQAIVAAAVGLAIVLSAWIIVDSIFKLLTGGNSTFGPWNQLQCPEFLEGEIKLVDTGKAPTLSTPASESSGSSLRYNTPEKTLFPTPGRPVAQ